MDGVLVVTKLAKIAEGDRDTACPPAHRASRHWLRGDTKQTEEEEEVAGGRDKASNEG